MQFWDSSCNSYRFSGLRRLVSSPCESGCVFWLSSSWERNSSLTRAQMASSSSWCGSCIQKNMRREVCRNFSTYMRPVLHDSIRWNSTLPGCTITSNSMPRPRRSLQQKCRTCDSSCLMKMRPFRWSGTTTLSEVFMRPALNSIKVPSPSGVSCGMRVCIRRVCVCVAYSVTKSKAKFHDTEDTKKRTRFDWGEAPAELNDNCSNIN